MFVRVLRWRYYKWLQCLCVCSLKCNKSCTYECRIALIFYEFRIFTSVFMHDISVVGMMYVSWGEFVCVYKYNLLISEKLPQYMDDILVCTCE